VAVDALVAAALAEVEASPAEPAAASRALSAATRDVCDAVAELPALVA